MKTKRISFLLALVLAAALLFTACGGTEGDASTTLPEDPSSATQTTEQTLPIGNENTAEQPSGEESTSESAASESTSEQESGSADASSTSATQPQTAAQTSTAAQTKKPDNKPRNIYKSNGTRKIWALVVGDVYVLFRSTAKGQVYELHVDAGDGYSVWSEGQWKLNDAKTQLTLTPTSQNENGNIGVAVGASKTYAAKNGVFTIDFTFEQGGKTSVKLDLVKDAL